MTPPIHLTTWGASGPKIVMIHGGAQGSSVGGARHFARQQALADRGFRIVVPDRPGHGDSPAPGRPDDAALDGRGSRSCSATARTSSVTRSVARAR